MYVRQVRACPKVSNSEAQSTALYICIYTKYIWVRGRMGRASETNFEVSTLLSLSLFLSPSHSPLTRGFLAALVGNIVYEEPALHCLSRLSQSARIPIHQKTWVIFFWFFFAFAKAAASFITQHGFIYFVCSRLYGIGKKTKKSNAGLD